MSVDLLPTEIRQHIGDALHHAVSQLFEPSATHVGPINTIGCFLLKFLTGQLYQPVAGSVTVHAAGAPFGIEARLEALPTHDYYVWIERHHDGGAIERIDFAARYWDAWAREQGVLWLGPPPRPFWDWADRIPKDHAEYVVHDEITRRIREGINAAIRHVDTDASAQAWQDAINSAVDHLMTHDAGIAFLTQAGIAHPDGNGR